MSNTSSRTGYKIIFNVLSTIFFLLVIVGLFRQLTGHSSQILSFASIIDIFSRTPSIDISILQDATIGGYWGPFDFLRTVLNFFSSIGEFILFISINLINVIVFVFYLLGNLFLL